MIILWLCCPRIIAPDSTRSMVMMEVAQSASGDERARTRPDPTRLWQGFTLLAADHVMTLDAINHDLLAQETGVSVGFLRVEIGA